MIRTLLFVAVGALLSYGLSAVCRLSHRGCPITRNPYISTFTEVCWASGRRLIDAFRCHANSLFRSSGSPWSEASLSVNGWPGSRSRPQ